MFAARGFGEFDVGYAVGEYGKDFAEHIWRIANDGHEDLVADGVRCRITDRMCEGIAKLKLDSKRLGFEDDADLLVGDSRPVNVQELEDHFLPDKKMESKPPTPDNVDSFRKCAEMQTTVWCLYFGRERYDERIATLRTLLELREDTPEIFSLRFIIPSWEQFVYDWIEKMFEGMRQLSQFCRNSDDINEIRRLALNRRPEGGIVWWSPKSFNMASSRGY